MGYIFKPYIRHLLYIHFIQLALGKKRTKKEKKGQERKTINKQTLGHTISKKIEDTDPD